MRVFKGFNQIGNINKPVVALGVFDGVHRGHSRIISACVKKANEINGTSVVVTFDPHPQKQGSIYSLNHRLKLFSELGADVCIVVNFNEAFARMKAVDFVKIILIKKIRARYVYVGKNFRFGSLARGNCKMLSEFSKAGNFSLKSFEVIKVNGQPVSSTNIRRLIKSGQLKKSEKLLTRPVSILGTVIRGNFIARSLGFPTANINPHHEVIPPIGIYAVAVRINKQKFFGICYIGTRPTLLARNALCAADLPVHIETHIFNFNMNVYKKDLLIEFVKKIREDKKFVSLHDLSVQVKKDIKKAKAIFSLP
ncbi:MAG: riboflavin biosynthesis protein RibF [Candidatus Omnitrophica bacterium]|nr:riboflavin biosynthesis protein RibF [Candidatus Omnitrophota bacterium]